MEAETDIYPFPVMVTKLISAIVLHIAMQPKVNDGI